MDRHFAYTYVVNGVQKELFTDLDLSGAGEGDKDAVDDEDAYLREYTRKRREFHLGVAGTGTSRSHSTSTTTSTDAEEEPHYCGRIVHSSNHTSMNSLISTGKIALELWDSVLKPHAGG